MLPDPGANHRAVGRRTPPTTCGPTAPILHVSGYSLMRSGSRAAALTAMDRAREAGMRISVDPASAALLARRSGVPRPRAARSISCCPTPTSSPRSATALPGVKESVVKLGVGGARWSDGRRTVSPRPSPVDDVIDTTGAGDAFAAGFLSAWPAEPEQALATGARARRAGRGPEGGRPTEGGGGGGEGQAMRLSGRNEPDPLRLHGQHLPLADGGGGHARARARGRASSTSSRSTAPAPAPGTWATRPTGARPRPPRTRRDARGAARQVRPRDFEHFDLLLAMDRENLRELRTFSARLRCRRQGAAAARVRSGIAGAPDLDVPDPYYGGPDGFETVLDQVEAACRGLLDTLR